MTLIVEDGTGLSNADALVSLDYCDAYHSDRGNSTWAGTDTVKEQAIRRASTFLSRGFRWKGRQLNGRAQAFPWPRSGVVDDEGYAVAGDAVPDEIEKAVAEAALRELAEAGSLTPDYTPAERVKSERVDVISVTYDLSRTDAESVRPVMLIVNDLVSGLIEGGGGSHLIGEAMR